MLSVSSSVVADLVTLSGLAVLATCHMKWGQMNRQRGGDRRSTENYISNTVTFFEAIYSGMLDGCMTFQLKRYSQHQWGHRQAISQPTGCVNSSRGTNLTIYSIHGTYVKVESAQSLTLHWPPRET